MAEPPSARVDPDRLKEGQQVWVEERAAVFLYLSKPAAVIRYPGERLGRVVALDKLRTTPPKP